MIVRRNNVTTSRRPVPSDLRFSPRHAALIRESWWLVVVAAVAFLTLILATYQKTDAGWSFSGAGTPIQNKGGVAGAWIADLLLYLFGVSAWWRSEEHTSELQSHVNLVCRLLLEKKKKEKKGEEIKKKKKVT